MNAKPFYQSKTIIINTLILIFVLCEQNFGLLESVLPSSLYKISAFLLPIINLLLRTITTAPVTLKKDQTYV
jgi:hypothetical protein